MNNNDTAKRTAHKVAAAIRESGRSVNSVAISARMDRGALRRRLAGAVAFDLDELDHLAAALGVPPSDLIAS